MSNIESGLQTNPVDDRDKVFYGLLDRADRTKQLLEESEGAARNDLKGRLFTTVATMSSLLVERMHEASFRKPLIAASPLQIVEEFAKDHSWIDLDIWREFRRTRNRFVHGKDVEISVDTLMKTVIPEFIKEYELLK